MFFDYRVYLLHEPDSFGQGDDNLLVMGDVVFGKGAAFAILEPFLADLVAANVKVPYFFRHAAKTGCLAFVDPDGGLRVTDFFDLEISAADKFGTRSVELGRFEQVQGDQFAAEFCERAEQLDR